ncbi:MULTISPECIES: glutaredoxin family protein [Aestuariimicrobium]|uniref:glutaredoxin family protein n=1 Tax=Aestuariimicrobium TaxID=396388 RepID=UPI0003B41945|nr:MULTISPECIES: glutaredoxin family protein [Aestuariimicrobium]CAI9404464.1 hypothetical protein AESSP_01213 [Aestuariimicrobium sp. T2.26MG-19.2B]
MNIAAHPGHGAETAPVPPQVTLLIAPGCHFCEDARAELAQRAARGEAGVELVDADSARGRELLMRHRPAMFPLVLVEGEWFSAGRLPRRKLDRALERLAPAGRGR